MLSTSEQYCGVMLPAVCISTLQAFTNFFFPFKGNKQSFNYIFFSFFEDTSEILFVNFGHDRENF